MMLAKNSLRSPGSSSRAIREISAPDRVDWSERPTIRREKSVTIPTPPTQAVAVRQNRRPWGSDSMSVRMDAPVVVKPDTLSKRALTKLKSPP